MTTSTTETPAVKRLYIEVPADDYDTVIDSFGGEAEFKRFVATQAAERVLMVEIQKIHEENNRQVNEIAAARREELYAEFGVTTTTP